MTRRIAGYCYDCRSNIRSAAEHRSTKTHRDAVYARSLDTVGPVDPGADFARAMRLARTVDNGTPEQQALAAASLGGYLGTVIVPDDPDAPDAWMPEPEPIRRAQGLDPCPRCGRNDWRSKRGREYHVNENPDCLRWRKPERHVYAMIGG